jgi:hypothetical protein
LPSKEGFHCADTRVNVIGGSGECTEAKTFKSVKAAFFSNISFCYAGGVAYKGNFEAKILVLHEARPEVLIDMFF